ncbi:MAG: hypothetical protein MUC96_32260 [Myxococcaceae bacterium]|nr:hypothetical protein [Myxococcaceae bacterium]
MGLAGDVISAQALAEASARFGDAQARTQALIQAGRFDEAVAVLEALLPASPSAADLLAIGNIHFRLNPDAALRFHRRAAELAPTSVRVALELAYDLHQRGEAREACPLYERYLAVAPQFSAGFALLAHCRLAGGDVSGAISAWKQAGLPRKHRQVESTLGEVFGPPSPWLVRRRLLEEARRAPGALPVAELLAQALVFQLDWWNVDSKVDLVELDLTEFGKHLSKQDREAVALLVAAARPVAPGDPALARRWSTFLARPPPGVPTPLYAVMANLGLGRQVVSVKELAPLAALMKRRAQAKTGTQADVELAAALAQFVGDEASLDALDALGWQRFKSRACAQSALIRASGSSKPSTPMSLAEAIAIHPDSPFLQLLALEGLGPDETEAQERVLVALILAEFKNLALSSEGLHDVAALHSFFLRLEAMNAAKP